MSAPGLRALDRLLASMQPELSQETFVFVAAPRDAAPVAEAAMTFEEAEGTTLVLREADAAALGLRAVYPSRRITLMVQSSLEAVGFLAAVLPPLAAAGISVNPVSAFHHDHLFVPADRAEEALVILRRIAANAAANSKGGDS